MIIGPVTETTKKKKKKTLTVTPIKTNKNTNKIAPISKTHAQQYNLDGSKKIAPTVSITTNNIANKGATNLINNTLQQDIKNKIFETATGQNKQKIDLSGKNTQSTTPVTKEGLEIQRNQLMTEKELQEKRDKLSDELFNYDREEKVKWWDDDLSFGQNLKNVGYKTFLENKNNKYVEDEKYNELKRRFELADNELKNKKVQRKSSNMDTLDKIGYTITGNVIDSTKGIESSVNKLFGQSTPIQSESFDEMMAEEARKQTTGIAGAGLDIVGSMSKMLPQMIVSGPINSSAAAMTVGFANYGGSAYNEAKQMGATEEQATAYGITIGGLETGLEKLLGGFESVYGKSALGNVTNKIMGKVITNTAFRQVASGMAGEFTEEYLQEFLQPIVRNAILEEENGADFWNAENLEEGVKQFVSQLFNSQNLYAGTLGAVSSGLMSGPSVISQNASINNEVKTIKEDINPKNIEEKMSYLTNKGYDTNTSIEIVNKALKETGQPQISVENIAQNETAQEVTSNTSQISQEIGQNQGLSNETINNTNKVENKAVAPINFDLQIENALNNNQSKGNIYLGKQTNSKIINLIKKITGIDITNRNQVLSKDYVRHLFKHSKETNPNQIPITKEDIKKIPDILSNPDTIVRGSDTLDASRKNKIPSIRYIKTDNTGKMYVVEAIPDKGNLQIKTMWKEPTKLIHSNNALHHTSETANSKSSTTLTDNNIQQNDLNVKSSDIITVNSMQQNKKNDTNAASKNVTRELENSSFSFKQKQLDIINRTNPADDDVHTWIRTVEDIKTFDEAFFEDGEFSGMDPDFTETMAKNSQGTGKIIVYSSYPIENGVFVSPSKMEASQYAGGDESKLYSKEVDINDVAWIDGAEGQYARVDNNNQSAKKVIAPIVRENNTIDERIKKNEETIKVSQMSDKEIKKISNTIAEQINKDGGFELKQRRWVETATKSEVLNNAISIEDLDASKTHYEPTSNKKTLEKANKQLDTLGYEEAIKYIEQKMNDERVSAKDIALAERLIQEAIKKGDMTTAQDLIMNTAILGTEYGQTIQALSIIQRLTPEGQLKMLDKIVSREKSRGNKTFEGVEITPQMVEKILKAYNNDGTYDQDDLNKRVEEVKQEIAGQLKTTFGEKADAWRYLSMLGNPKTHIRNIVSNVAMKGTIAYKNAIARTIETAIPIKNRTKTWKKSSEVVKNFAKEQAEELKSVISGETKYSEKVSIEAKKTIFKTKFLEKLYQGNSTLLDLEDWLFSKSAFESTFREYLAAQGIRTEQDIQNNPKIITEAQNYSIEQAQIATFRQYSKIASEINRLERKYKGFGLAIKAVMPFKKTPVNIAKAGVSYSPLGFIKNLTYDMAQVIKGNMEASQYIDNLSQGLSGTSLTLLGYALAKAGILKGDDDNDKESKYDSALGNKAYTIKLGENYYSLSWLSPVGMPLFVGANAYKELEENKEIDMNVVTDMLTSTINPISEMSLVSSLTDAIKSFSTNGTASIESSIENAIKSYVGQYFPTLLSQIASLTDAKKRSTSASSNSKWKYGEEVLNSIKYKIPGLRQTLPTYTDSWGKPQKQAENIFVRAWETFIAPYTRYEDKKTNLDKEIMEVYYKSGNVDVIPGTPNSYITYNKERYNMSNKEYETFKKTYGTTSNNYIKAIIKNDRYKSATYEDKAKIIDKVYDYALTNAQLEYFNKHNIEIDSNYTNQSEAKKLETFKEYNYSYSDIADTIISNYYKYKRN